jgi:integrase/recombinase XerD
MMTLNPPTISPDTTLAMTLLAWQESLRKAALSTYTIKNYTVDIKLLASHLDATQSVGQITTADLNGFLHWLQYQRPVPCSAKTLDRRITTIKSYFRWLTPAAGLSENPAEAVLNVSVRSPLPTVLTVTQVRQVCNAARLLATGRKPDLRPYALISLVLETGLRKGEVARLEHSHLNLSDASDYYFYVRYADKRHRHKERKFALSPEWVATYHEYHNAYPNTDLVFPWSIRRLEYLLADVAKLVDLPDGLSFDTLRWTAALQDFRAQLDSEQQRRKLGLSKIQWVEIRRKLAQLAARDVQTEEE